jgi:hypothetical protein
MERSAMFWRDTLLKWLEQNPHILGLARMSWAGLLVFGLALAATAPVSAEEGLLRSFLTSPVDWLNPPSDERIDGGRPDEPEYSVWGAGHIKIEDPEAFPRITALQSSNPDSLLSGTRSNLLGLPVPKQWEFYNLVNTDRPDFTDATFSVGKGVTIIESGYTFRRSNTPDTRFTRTQLPEVLLRHGLTDELEFRIKWNGYILTEQRDLTTGTRATQFGGDDLILGVKYEVMQQREWLPMLTIVTGSTVPVGTNGVSSYQMQPYFNVVYGWGSLRWLYLKGSTGVDFLKSSDNTRVIQGSLENGPTIVATRDNVSEWHQSFSLLYQLSPRVGGFSEWFCFFTNNDVDNTASHFIDTGLFIYATPNIQFDVRVGQRLSNRSDTFFTGAGLSVRY